MFNYFNLSTDADRARVPVDMRPQLQDSRRVRLRRGPPAAGRNLRRERARRGQVPAASSAD